MITQVSGLNGNGVTIKDPRRKSQSVRFKHRPIANYGDRCTFHEASHAAKKDAITRSVILCAGAAAFVSGCCLWKGTKAMGSYI